MVCITNETPLGKTTFSLASSYLADGNIFFLWIEAADQFHSQNRGPHHSLICAGPMHVSKVSVSSMWICPAVVKIPCFLGFLRPLWITVFLLLLSQGSLSCQMIKLMDTSHSGQSVPRCLTLFTMSRCESLFMPIY